MPLLSLTFHILGSPVFARAAVPSSVTEKFHFRLVEHALDRVDDDSYSCNLSNNISRCLIQLLYRRRRDQDIINIYINQDQNLVHKPLECLRRVPQSKRCTETRTYRMASLLQSLTRLPRPSESDNILGSDMVVKILPPVRSPVYDVIVQTYCSRVQCPVVSQGLHSSSFFGSKCRGDQQLFDGRAIPSYTLTIFQNFFRTIARRSGASLRGLPRHRCDI